MKFHPILHAIFGTIRSRFIQFSSVFSVMKGDSFVFLQLKPCILLRKRVNRKEIFRLLSGWVKIHQVPHVICETTSQFFFLNFPSLFSVMRFGQKEPIKVQNFRLSTVQVNFHQIHLYFDRLLLLKEVKISAKKGR